MYQVSILDDEPEQTELIARMIEQSPLAKRLSITPLLTPAEALSVLTGDELPHILIVDVRLGERVNGIELVRTHVPACAPLQVIYVSGYLEYAPAAYHTKHAWFLSKPIEQAELDAALGRAIEQIEAERSKPLVIHHGATIVRILPADVLYIESERRKVRIHCRTRTVEAYARISELEALLPEQFARCHKSFLVNMGYISELGQHEVLLANGERLPVSQRSRHKLSQRFIDHVGRSL